MHRVLHWRTTEADYSTRTWFVSVIHAAGPVQGPLPTPADGVLGPEQLRKWLEHGTIRVAGHGRVDGHQATRLRAALGVVTMEFWLDSRTFRPLRMIKSSGAGADNSLVFSESWLARTPRLVSLANHPQIPAGFTRAAPPK